MAHALDHHNAALSEGEPSLLWSGLCLESLFGSGLARIPCVGCDEAKRGCARVSPLARRVVAPHREGEEVVRATPWFSPLVHHGGGVNGPP